MKIHHIISAGLEHGKYYRVYVTQVNKNGIESPRSIPSLIRVGDVEAPPMPVLSVDTSEFSNGCYADGETITVKLRWTESDCDDLDKYVVYRWSSMDGGVGERGKDIADTAEAQYPMTSGTLSTEITGLAAGTNVYFGIQAIDLSRNTSNIYVIKVDAEDLTQLNQPTSPITVEAYGIWALRVSTPCPQFSNIKYVVFYRDGWKQLSPVIFHKGLDAEIIDALDVLDGLTHFYTYLYITKDGRKSPMSAPSKSATAKPIDTSYIDSAVIEELKKAWQTDDISSTAALLAAASKQAAQVQELYKQLKDVTEDYTKLYNNFTLAANEIKLLSAKVESQGDTLSAYGTAIEQNAHNITLRATKGDIDSATGQLRSGLVSMIDLQADRITSIVADTSKNTSSITQLSNAIQQKVSVGDLNAQIMIAVQSGISVAYIKANRIVLDGQMLLEGNARINGRLYSNDIALVDSSTNKVIWGAGSGTINPTVVDSTIPGPYAGVAPHYGNYYGGEGPALVNDEIYPDISYRACFEFYYTPRPPVNFNGTASVKATVTFSLALQDSGNTSMGDGDLLDFVIVPSTEGTPASTGTHPAALYRPKDWTWMEYPDGAKTFSNFYNSGVTMSMSKFWYNYNVSASYSGNLRIGEQMKFTVYLRANYENEGKYIKMPVFWNIRAHMEAI